MASVRYGLRMEPHRIDIYAILRSGVPGYDGMSNAFQDDQGFNTGLSRVAASITDEIVAAGGRGTVIEPAHLAAYVFTAATVVEWMWNPADGSTVTIHPRGDLASIEVDDAPSDIDPRTGHLGYTLVYPWGQVPLREASGNPGPRDAFPSFVEDLSRS